MKKTFIGLFVFVLLISVCGFCIASSSSDTRTDFVISGDKNGSVMDSNGFFSKEFLGFSVKEWIAIALVLFILIIVYFNVKKRRKYSLQRVKRRKR